MYYCILLYTLTAHHDIHVQVPTERTLYEQVYAILSSGTGNNHEHQTPKSVSYNLMIINW